MCGRPDDLAGLIERGRDVADLGDGEQPLVPAVGAGHAAEEVDVFDRVEPFDVELGEPAEIEPLREHRMHVAMTAILDRAPHSVHR